MVCVLPLDHALVGKPALTLDDIAAEPFIAFMQSSYTRLWLDKTFETAGLKPHVVAEATTAQNVRELLAAGMGIAIAHPVYAERVQDQVAIRPFTPENMLDFQLCRLRHGRNRRLVTAFVEKVQETAANFST